jgi:Zn-dependent M16 (insulinase) family peptidase
MQLTRIQLDHTILGWAKNFLSPIRPLAATNETLSYYKTGKDQEWLTAYYQRGLKTTPSELKRAILTVLEQAKGCERVCVIANQSTVDKLCKDYQDVTWTHDNLSTMNA